MKELCSTLVLIASFFVQMNAQIISNEKMFSQGSYPLSVSDNYTTNLIFPFAIKGVDRGSQEIIVQKAKGIENILQLKAAKEGFAETNLSVITGDGKLYSFLLNYSQHPPNLNYAIGGEHPEEIKPVIPKDEINEGLIEENCKKVMAFKGSNINHVSAAKNSVLSKITGLFVEGNVFYFRFSLSNKSVLSYDIDQVRFLIRDKHKTKRTATQEIEMTPLYNYNDTPSIAGHSRASFVVALQKFTIPDKKDFIIQIIEKNGGRHLELKVRNKKITKAIPIE